jgi:hypothetical protein
MQIAKEVDFLNCKTGNAIQTARPFVPAHDDHKAMGKQVKYLKLV